MGIKKCVSVFKVYDYKYRIEEKHYEAGEKYGGEIVKKIDHHFPMGEGDQHYCEVYFENGDKIIVYRPDEVEFEGSDEYGI